MGPDPLRGFPKRGWHDSLFPARRRWKCRISFGFRDAQWARIGPLLPTDTRGMARVDDRRVLSGIVHALRNGGRWADCPREVYGPKKTLYNRFVTLGGARHLGTDIQRAGGRRRTPPTGCSSIQPASRFIAAPAAEKGSLGPWHRPHQGGPQHQASRCLRCERQAPHPAPDTRKRP